MVNVTALPKVYNKTPVPIVSAIQSELEEQYYNRGIKAKRKWLENVEIFGTRYAVSCHEINKDEVEITNIRQQKGKKYSKSMKKEKRLRK
jgi:hypothetical protein